MRLATLRNGQPDGRLVIVSRDGTRCVAPGPQAPTLQHLMEHWSALEAELRALAQALESGTAAGATVLDTTRLAAPLPRAWQWLDGSAFQSHGDLLSTVFNSPKLPYEDRPLMYQGISDRFLSGTDDVPLPSADDGIDFEGEFGVITDAVPMGTSKADAAAHIRLVVLINDWSLRRIAPIEMKTGFGWVQAKPACSIAPFAVTPDELGDGWRDSRVQMKLEIDWNGQRFGNAHAGAMAFGFADLVAHAAYSRDLVPGTIIGSGTVSNDDFRVVGSSCIAERRAIETLDEGAARTPYMSFGDRVRLQARGADGRDGPFGAIDQLVVRAGGGGAR